MPKLKGTARRVSQPPAGGDLPPQTEGGFQPTEEDEQEAAVGGGGDPPQGEDQDTPGGKVKTDGGLAKSEELYLR